MIPYIIILILAMGLSFFLGAFILGPKVALKTDDAKKETVIEELEDVKEEVILEELIDDADVQPGKKSAGLSFLFPGIDSEKGLQKTLADKSGEINGIRTILDTRAADTAIKKMSDNFLFASGVIAFEKYLLFIAGHIILIIVIPVFIIISVILIIANKDKRKTAKLIIKTVVFSLIIIFILPASFYLSALAEKTMLSHNITSLVSSIETNSGNFADSALNYFVIFIFVYIVFPVLIITGLICLVKYFKKRLLADN